MSLTRQYQWMLRVFDAAAAVAGRGFPAQASASQAAGDASTSRHASLMLTKINLAVKFCPVIAGWMLTADGRLVVSGDTPGHVAACDSGAR